MRAIPNRSRLWRTLFGVFLIGIISVNAYAPSTAGAQTATPPSFPFNHEVMVQAGIPCLYCHADALKSPAAGIPSMAKCMGCHQVIATGQPQVKLLTQYWDRQEPILWPRLERLPRFVYFSHRVHVGPAGLNCERCHGDVGHMALAQPVVNMNMGWCLGCHEAQPNAIQLQDCMVCHQ